MRCTIGTTVVMTGLVVAMLAFRPEVRDDATIVQAQDEPKTEPPSDKPARKERIGVAKSVTFSRNEMANVETRDKLATLIDVEFTETPLGTALDGFSTKIGTQVYLDPKALVDLAITSDDPVTLGLKQVPAEMALDLILRPHQLAYTLRSGVVMVSSQAEIDASPETRVYYVPADSTNELIQLIPSTVAPATWATGGGLGAIVPFRDSLVISQTSEAHQDIEKLLKDLEPVLAKGPRKAAESAEGSGYGAAGQPGYGAAGGYGSMSRGGYGGARMQPGYGQTGGGAGYGSTQGGYGGVGGQPGYGAASRQPGDGQANPVRREPRRGRDAPSRESKPTPSIEPATGASPLQPVDDPAAPSSDALDDTPTKSSAEK